MFDLNEKKFSSNTIFNNGQGGKVDNVKISIERKKQDEPDTYPDYKMIVEDKAGGKINQGYYYPKANAQKSEEINAKAEIREVSRIVHIAKTVMGEKYQLPAVDTAKEAFDILFKLISENAAAKLFNVFVTYGTTGYVSKYMGLRYFDFIEESTANPSRLRTKPGDILTRVEADPEDTSTTALKKCTTTEDWV